RPSIVVDIGAAEGYYAVGFARRLPKAQVIAFEMDPGGRRLLAEMAILNRVDDRVTVRGKCEQADLIKLASRYPEGVYIIDVEGGEETLLSPSIVPTLHRASILVEVHEFVHLGITERLVNRFHTSHDIKEIWQEPRNGIEFPWTTLYTRLVPKAYLDW